LAPTESIGKSVSRLCQEAQYQLEPKIKVSVACSHIQLWLLNPIIDRQAAFHGCHEMWNCVTG